MLQNRGSNLVGSHTIPTTGPTATEPPSVSPPAAPRAGAELAAARERLDWSLEDVAMELRIRPLYLRALEAGHIGELPGNAYAVGFLRTYAAALGLDPQEMVRRFKAEAAEVSRQTRLAFPVPAPERSLPAGALALLGLVLVVLVYAGWYRLSGEGRLPAEAVMTVPARLAPLAEQALPLPAQPASPPVAAALAPAPPPSNDPPPVPMAISPSSAAAAPVNPLPDPAGAATEPAAAPAEDQSRIMIRATADAWIQVRERAGSVLLNRVLKAGETWPVPARANLLLTVGNAGGTDIVLDGTSTAPLGGLGVVRRDLPLDPDSIKDGKLAASAIIPVAARR